MGLSRALGAGEGHLGGFLELGIRFCKALQVCFCVGWTRVLLERSFVYAEILGRKRLASKSLLASKDSPRPTCQSALVSLRITAPIAFMRTLPPSRSTFFRYQAWTTRS